eukprot:TRINITY_DN6587_c0_g1_i2.p3 TRINITY_DN6587_c0_g1~~TRINITY_DN6587_c0_g1_i2.p3  ORF type:complete len:213 (+),score=54.30 TRINITY_DN6587_c0_g1_i2:558-1196(+)
MSVNEAISGEPSVAEALPPVGSASATEGSPLIASFTDMECWERKVLTAFDHRRGRYFIYLIAAALLGCCVVLNWWRLYREWQWDYVPQLGVKRWPETATAIYCGYYVIGWGIGLGILTLSWALGHGGMLRRALEARFWTPLARLTFGVYLIHPTIYMWMSWQNRAYPQWYVQSVVYWVAGTAILAVLFSFVMHLLVEKPVANLITTLTGGKS